MTLKLISDATTVRTQRYPDKDGVFAMVSDISGGGTDHYRGTDHATVVSPIAGDYTIETLSTDDGSFQLTMLHNGTSWQRITPFFIGTGFDQTPAQLYSSFNSFYPLTSPCIGDFCRIITAHAMTGSHTESFMFTGAVWENMSNSDYVMQLYSIEQTLEPLPNAVSNLQTAVTALQEYTPPSYYAGDDHGNPISTPMAGSYTVELGNIMWVYDGTTWAKVSDVIEHYKGHYPHGTDTLNIPTGVHGDYVVIANNSYGDAPHFWSDAYSDWLMSPNFNQTISIANNANTYRGSDHSTVTGASAGDYTVEAGVLWVYDTSWHEVSGGGSSGLDHYRGHFLTEAAVDATIGIAGDYATYSYLTEIGGIAVDRLVYWDATYNGGVGGWMDILNGIDASEKFNMRDKRSYVGNNHNSSGITPTAGAYTVETGGVLWVYNGTTWYRQSLKYWIESYDATKLTTKWNPLTASNKGVMINSTTGTIVSTTGTIISSTGTVILSSATNALVINSDTATVEDCDKGGVINSSQGYCNRNHALVIGYNSNSIAPASFNTSATPDGDLSRRSGTAIIPYFRNMGAYPSTSGYGVMSGVMLPQPSDSAIIFTIHGDVLLNIDGVLYSATIRSTGWTSDNATISYTHNSVTWLSTSPAVGSQMSFSNTVLNNDIGLIYALNKAHTHLSCAATFILTYVETPLIV